MAGQKEVEGGSEGEKGQEGQILKDGGVLMMTGKLGGVVLIGGKRGRSGGFEDKGRGAGGCKGVEVGSGRGSERL